MSLKQQNFTLVEIVAVLMIFTLVIGLAVGSMRKIPALVSLQQVVNELKHQCAEVRKTASCQQRNIAIWYDPESRMICSEETDILLPDDLKIMVANRDIREETEKYNLFLFFPDGSGEEQKLLLKLDGDAIALSLSPLTGRITTKDAAD